VAAAANALLCVSGCRGNDHGQENDTRRIECKRALDFEKEYKDGLRQLWVELVKLQRHLIKCNDKILIMLGTAKDKRPIRPDPQIVFAHDASNPKNGHLAK
jgi:hypothetical protein